LRETAPPLWQAVAGKILLEWEVPVQPSSFEHRRVYDICIPPLNKLIDSVDWVVVFGIFKEVNNKIVKQRIMPACMLVLPVPCRVQGEHKLREKASETNSK
jgi:hypothetical protein